MLFVKKKNGTRVVEPGVHMTYCVTVGSSSVVSVVCEEEKQYITFLY